MKLYYVYELVNLMGTVEHVGLTVRPKIRFGEHTKNKPCSNTGHGKFYNRLDISMHIIASYKTKKEALQAEHDLQVYWGIPTDRSKMACKGSKNGRSKLTENQVREIKKLLLQGVSGAEISRKYKIGELTVSFIKNEKQWKHITI